MTASKTPTADTGGDHRSLDELEARQAEVVSRLNELDAEHAGKYLDPRSEAGIEWSELAAEREQLEKVITQGRARQDYLKGLKDRADAQEAGAAFHTAPPSAVRGDDIYDLSTIRLSMSSPEQGRADLRDRALRAIEASRFPHERADESAVRGHLDRLLQVTDTPTGDLARHLLATGSPTYHRAFGKAIQGKPLSGAELQALSTTTTEGGFAVPFQLDPTIIPTSDGAVNPYRRISRIVQLVNSNTWQGVTADDVSVTRDAEGTEDTDASPTLAQPEVKVEKVHAFIPFTIEIGQDWPSLQSEMAKLLQDGKDEEEATSFTVGNGTPPNAQGITDGATTTVDTASSGTFAANVDLFALEAGLGARFRARGQWVANRKFYTIVRGQQSMDDGLWVPSLQQGLDNNPTGNTGYNLIGYPANEVSEDLYTSPVSAGDLLAVLGDFSRYFAIVDRIGMTIELIPHLFGTARNMPTGERGLYAWWRNNSAVIDANAFRTLKVKA